MTTFKKLPVNKPNKAAKYTTKGAYTSQFIVLAYHVAHAEQW